MLLLDEPLSNLDPQGVGVLAEALGRWRRDRVVLLTHHGALPLEVDQVLELGG